MSSDTTCSVCFEAFQQPCVTPCRHTFCRQCALEAMGMTPPKWHGACPLCRQPVSVYTLRDVDSGKALASPAVSTIFGSVFVQNGGIGVASYHFDSPEDCYISYSKAPRQWKLQDGTAPPEKKPFAGASWDEEARTFRGTIEWDPPFGGARRWDYEIVFAGDFSAVVGGKVSIDGGEKEQKFEPPWSMQGRALSYLRWTPPPATPFGSVFVQGLHYAGMLEGIASYHFDSEDDCYISYSNAPPQWLLDDGKRPPAKKPFEDTTYAPETRTFCGTVRWEPAFQGSARWAYRMEFAEDFERIVGGSMTAYSQDGEELGVHSFVDVMALPESVGDRTPLLYVRRPGALGEPQLSTDL